MNKKIKQKEMDEMALAFPGIMEILIIGTVLLIPILFFGILYYIIKKATKAGIKESENK